MKIPFFPGIGTGDPSSIVNLALYELGLSEEFLLRAVIAANGKPKFTAGEWDFGKSDFSEWVWICKKLYLPLDCTSIGYSRMTQRAWVGQAILEGAYVLPITDKVRILFREYISLQRQSIRREKEHYGPELRRRIVLKRFEERKLRRRIRRHNYNIGKSAREKYKKLFAQSAIGAPILAPIPGKKRERRRVSLPGLRTQLRNMKGESDFTQNS